MITASKVERVITVPDRTQVIMALHGTAEVWDLTLSPKRNAAWLVPLAEALSAETLDSQGILVASHLRQAEASTHIRRMLAQEPEDSEWAPWGRWVLTNSLEGTISPYSKITMREYVDRLIAEGYLEDAGILAEGDAELLQRIVFAQQQLKRIDQAVELRRQQGDPRATEELLPLVYAELRQLAAARMAKESPAQTLQPTALVHEAWLRLVAAEQRTWQNRAHFFGAAAEAMRRILIDNARRKRALRHGGGQQRLDLQDVDVAAGVKDDELLSVHEALDKFAAQDAQKAELVKLRYFVGLKIEEAAQVLNISEPTAKRWWGYARAWLFDEIKRSREE